MYIYLVSRKIVNLVDTSVLGIIKPDIIVISLYKNTKYKTQNALKQKKKTLHSTFTF